MGNAGSDMALMLLTEDKAVVGCGVLYATTPGGTWTASERAERSMSLAMMHTHPNQRVARLTGLMTLWVFDYAARCTSPVLQWVRCSVPDNRLACWFVSGGPVLVGPLRVRRHPAEAARGPRSSPGLLQLSDSKRGSPETLTI